MLPQYAVILREGRQGGRQGSREPKTAQCGAVLLNANVWDLRLFSVRFFAAGPKVDPRVKCIMS